MRTDAAQDPAWLRWACAVAVVVVLTFAVRRVLVDVPALGSPLPASDEDAAYARHTALAYLHIVPACAYLVGGALQLNAGFRARRPAWHRRVGRVVLGSGLVAGAFAIVLGLLWPFGGPSEAITTVTFGMWFQICLLRALVAIRAGRVAAHRRWMIRAYAIGSAVGTIRILVGPLVVPIGFRPSFAVGFPVAFVLHAAAAEWYLRRSPAAGVRPAASLGTTS